MPQSISHKFEKFSESKYQCEIGKVVESQKVKSNSNEEKQHFLRDKSTKFQLIFLNKRQWVKSVRYYKWGCHVIDATEGRVMNC